MARFSTTFRCSTPNRPVVRRHDAVDGGQRYGRKPHLRTSRRDQFTGTPHVAEASSPWLATGLLQQRCEETVYFVDELVAYDDLFFSFLPEDPPSDPQAWEIARPTYHTARRHHLRHRQVGFVGW